jgi:hypothetical protein
MYFPIQAIKGAVSTTCNTNYPPNVKIERLRALHMVCKNLEDSIHSTKHWDELKLVSNDILERATAYQKQLPEGVITHY